MRVLVSGSTGLIGSALVEALPAHDHEPVRLVRGTDPGDVASIPWDPAARRLDPAALDDVDAVVHLAGAGIGDERWNEERKREILASRVDGTATIATAIAAAASPPSVLLSGAAIGIYGSRGDEQLTESSSRGTGFLADVVAAWEAETAAVPDPPTRVVTLRTGVVLSAEGGSLATMLPFFKLGIGGRIGDGSQWFSWITIDDVVEAIIWLLDHEVRGPVNLTAPTPVTNREFTRTLGSVLHRPTLLPIPKPALWARLGREATEEMLYASQRVLPSVLADHGFTFHHPELEPGLRAVLGAD